MEPLTGYEKSTACVMPYFVMTGVVGGEGPVSWPPTSHDANYFSLWSDVKVAVYSWHPHLLPDLQKLVATAFAQITPDIFGNK
jgi:hypothetical protein